MLTSDRFDAAILADLKGEGMTSSMEAAGLGVGAGMAGGASQFATASVGGGADNG